MPESPDIAAVWSILLERRPGTRGAMQEDLLPIVEAAYAEPRLRALYPFPTHGTLRFLHGTPPWREPNHDDLPFILYDGPPYKVYTSGYGELLGEAGTPAEAVALVVSHLPPGPGPS